MGRTIDKIALNALIIFTYYLFFMAAFASIPVACALTFLASALTHRLLDGLTGRWKSSRRAQKKALQKRIGALLDEWTLIEPPHGQIREALKALYPETAEEGTEIVVLPRPAACPPLESAACFELWQMHRPAKRLLIACTGRVSPPAFSLAQTLSSPCVRILDRALLAAALEKHPELIPESAAERKPARRKRRRLTVDRKHAPRCILSGAMLLAMHLLLGNWLYLLTGLALLTLAAVALKKPRTPEKLF